MRFGLSSVCSAALIGVVLSAGAATAQSRPGWVDPPARASQPETATEAAPAAPQASPKDFAKDLAKDPAKPSGLSETVTSDGGMARRSDPAAARRQTAQDARQQEARQDEARAPGRSGASRRHRRLARVPAILPAAPPVAGASEARFPEWASASQRLTVDYLDSVSAPGDAMVATAPRFYAERVRFHGRTLSMAGIIAEKRHFVRRWPERRYEPQRGSLHTACNAQSATCIVHATFDFRAGNPARGAQSQGVSELVLTIGFAGDRPVIVGESSRVLRRYGTGPLSAIAGARRGA